MIRKFTAVIAALLMIITVFGGCGAVGGTDDFDEKTASFVYNVPEGWTASAQNNDTKATYTNGPNTSIMVSVISLSSASLDGAVVEAKNSLILSMDKVDFTGEPTPAKVGGKDARIVDLTVTSENVTIKCQNYYVKVGGTYYLFQYSSTDAYDRYFSQWEEFLKSVEYKA